MNQKLIDKMARMNETYEKYGRDFFGFCQGVLGYAENPHYALNKEHRSLCEFLNNRTKKFKLILMPRCTFKSWVSTIGYSLWRLMVNPNLRILIYSDATSKAQGFLTGIKHHILGKVGYSRFRHLLGEWETDPRTGKWNDSEILVTTRIESQVEPTVSTAGIETSQVGRHYDLIIFDDIVSDKNVTTKDQMDKVSECYSKSLSLLRPGGEVLMVGTRWNFGDLYGRIIAENDDKQSFEIFHRNSGYNDGKLLFDDIGESSLTWDFLNLQKKEQGSYVFSCNPYEAPIIMSDLTAKPIGEVIVGEEVIGWKKGKGGRQRLVKSKVLKVQSRLAKVVNIKLESGRTIRCTPDHNWFTNRNDKTHKEYRPAKVGSKLQYIMKPYFDSLTGEEMKFANWLGGFYDGEGSCTSSAITFSQSEILNKEVCDRLEQSLDYLGFDWNSTIRQPSNTALGKETKFYWLKGGRDERRRFMLQCRPSKSKKILDSFFKYVGGGVVRNEDKVLSITPGDTCPVYALQTTTGNYIAWGYGSKNCLYENEPTDPETAVFKVKDFSFYGDIKSNDLYITCTVDPAGKGEDFTAITVVGTDHNMDMHILEVVNRHLQPSGIIDTVITLHYKYKFKILGIETNFFRGMLALELERRTREEHTQDPENFPLFGKHEFEASSRRGEGKENRIRGLQPYHERGALKFPGQKVELLKGGFSQLSYQMIQFPNSAHDDILDSLAYHIPLVRKGGVVKKKGPPRNSPAWLEQQSLGEELERVNSLPSRFRPSIDSRLAFS